MYICTYTKYIYMRIYTVYLHIYCMPAFFEDFPIEMEAMLYLSISRSPSGRGLCRALVYIFFCLSLLISLTQRQQAEAYRRLYNFEQFVYNISVYMYIYI